MTSPLRVALFTDSFNEANGVATVSRNFVEFARATDLPFACIHAGKRTSMSWDRSVASIELKRSAASFRLDADLSCDLLLNRYRNWIVRELSSFRPDIIHITGPGDLGVLGFWIAHILRVPLVASWHTNLHEYVARRLDSLLKRTPRTLRDWISQSAERQSLRALSAFYRLPRFLLAPNQNTVDLLRERTGRPAFLMGHGVDLQRFSPRPCDADSRPFRIGYAGRLTPEKNVRYFAELERKLLAAGQTNFRILFVGQGSEQNWLKQNLQFAEFTGVLRGQDLAAAFASMDAFVFPSHTDTFGLVLLEAMASGVPVVVGKTAGSRLGLEEGEGGLIREDLAQGVLALMQNAALRRQLGMAARRFASARSWCGVFTGLYQTYQEGLEVKLPRAPWYKSPIRNGSGA